MTLIGRIGVLLGIGALVAVTAAAQVRMARWYTGFPPPPHPTIIYGEYKGKDYPIVAVAGETPQVEVEGKLRRLSVSRKAHYAPRRGTQYAPGSLSLSNMRAGGTKTNLILMFNTGGSVDTGTVSARSDFSATVVPTDDYEDCYVAIVFFDQGFLEGTTSSPQASVQFERIKDLKAGVPNVVKLNFGYVDNADGRLGFFPLFFTRGFEIRSDQSELIAQFFRQIEDRAHTAIVENYRAKNASANVPLRPYLQIPPLFADPAVLEAAPDTAEVTFMVSEEGRLENLQFETRLPDPVAAVLHRTLNAWLFLPRLKQGRPERTMVRMPLQLGASNSSVTPGDGAGTQ